MMTMKIQLLFVIVFVINTFAHPIAPDKKRGTDASLPKVFDLNSRFNHDLHGIFSEPGSHGISGLDSRGGRGKSHGNGGEVETGGTHRRGGSGRRGGSNRRGGSRKRLASRWRWWTPL